MKLYKVVHKGIRLSTGALVTLTPQQAKPRMEAGSIRFKSGKVYELVTATDFKVGEEIGLDNPDKVTLQSLEALETEKGKKKAGGAPKTGGGTVKSKKDNKAETGGDPDKDDQEKIDALINAVCDHFKADDYDVAEESTDDLTVLVLLQVENDEYKEIKRGPLHELVDEMNAATAGGEGGKTPLILEK